METKMAMISIKIKPPSHVSLVLHMCTNKEALCLTASTSWLSVMVMMELIDT